MLLSGWSVLLLFRLSITSSSLCTVSDFISSNIHEVLLIDTSANMFVFGDFNVNNKDWLTYSGGTYRPGELCYDFSISSQMTLHRWLTFLFSSLTVFLTVLLFWMSSFRLTLVFDPEWLSLHWIILIILLFQFPLTFRQSQNSMSILVLIGMVFMIIWDLFHGRISLNSLLLLAASGFCESVQVRIDVYIPHRKYQVKSHSSPWFSAFCTAAIVYWSQFFCLHQKNKSGESKVKFTQASNRCKRILEAAKLAYANKT